MGSNDIPVLKYVRHEDVGSIYTNSTYLDDLQDEMKQENRTCMEHDLAVIPALWVQDMPVISVGVESDWGIMFRAFLSNQYVPLLFVLAVTFYYQSVRFWNNWGTMQQTLDATIPLNNQSYFVLYEYAYNIVLDGRVVQTGSKPIYAPTGPDLARWLEYASTSPFQVFLVATTVGCRDVTLIGGLMTLQSALVSYGYVIELMMDETYKKYIEERTQNHGSSTDQDDAQTPLVKKENMPSSDAKMISVLKIPIKTPDNSGNVIAYNQGMPMNDSLVKRAVKKYVKVLSFFQMRFLIVLSQAWLWHVVIWSILLQQFTNQTDMYTRCDRGKTPPFVYAIVYGQCGFFSLFGFVQTFQYLNMLHKWYTYADTQETKTQETNTKLDDESRKRWWLGYTKAYSILSVTSKLFLDITFLAGVWQLSTGNDTDSN